MNNEPFNYLILGCTCSAMGHSVRFGFFPDDRDKSAPMTAYIDVALDPDPSFWHRLRNAWRYIFNRTCNYACSTEVLLEGHDFPKLQAWLDKAREEHTRHEIERAVWMADARKHLEGKTA